MGYGKKYRKYQFKRKGRGVRKMRKYYKRKYKKYYKKRFGGIGKRKFRGRKLIRGGRGNPKISKKLAIAIANMACPTQKFRYQRMLNIQCPNTEVAERCFSIGTYRKSQVSTEFGNEEYQKYDIFWQDTGTTPNTYYTDLAWAIQQYFSTVADNLTYGNYGLILKMKKIFEIRNNNNVRVNITLTWLTPRKKANSPDSWNGATVLFDAYNGLTDEDREVPGFDLRNNPKLNVFYKMKVKKFHLLPGESKYTKLSCGSLPYRGNSLHITNEPTTSMFTRFMHIMAYGDPVMGSNMGLPDPSVVVTGGVNLSIRIHTTMAGKKTNPVARVQFTDLTPQKTPYATPTFVVPIGSNTNVQVGPVN